jgi:glycosyltransferase involved in cell wall biosynthesis
MRIAIFTDAFYPYVSGVETAIFTLIKGLADRGHKVYLIAPKYGGGYKEFKYPNIEVFRVKSFPALFYEGFNATLPVSFSATKFLLNKDVDVIHFHTPLTLGMQAILFSKIYNKPLVGTFHTFISDPEYLRHIGLEYKFVEKMAWAYSNSFYNQCDLVTSPSQSTKRALLKNKVKSPIKVISNGINFGMFDNKNSAKIRKKYNSGKLLLFVGRIAHEKNLPYLLRCFKKALHSVKDLKMLIVGQGPQFNEIKHIIHTHNLSKNVFLLGQIQHAKLVKSGIFGACDIFVTASTTENQPMTVLEAQANGLVCIGLNARGIPDLVKNKSNGFVLPVGNENEFANAIIKLATNEKLYKKMREATFKEIKKHDIKNVIAEWEKTYHSLLKSYHKQS